MNHTQLGFGAFAEFAIPGLLAFFVFVLFWLVLDFIGWRKRLTWASEADADAAVELMSAHLHEHHTREGRRLIVAGGASSVMRALQAAATSSGAWRIGPAFTGIALVLTFFIIGDVMQQIPLDDTPESSKLLQRSVDEMGSKFWISAAGVLATLLYQLVSNVLRENLRGQVRKFVAKAPSLIVDERAWERDVAERRHEEANARLQAQLQTLIDHQASNVRLSQISVDELQRQTSVNKRSAEGIAALDVMLRGAAASIQRSVETSSHRIGLLGQAVANEGAATRQSFEAGIGNLHETLHRVSVLVHGLHTASSEGNDLARAHTKTSADWSRELREHLKAMAVDLRALGVSARSTSERAESIEAALQGGLEPLVSNVAKMADTVLGQRIEELVQRLQRVLGTELAEHLKPLREDIRGQTKEEHLKGLATQIQAAMTGGASDATKSFHETMENLTASLPKMLDQVRAAALQAQEANQQAFAALAAEATRDLPPKKWTPCYAARAS